MHDYLPLLIVGATISLFAAIFIVAFALMKNKKESIGFDRNMKDSVIIKRLMKYAKPHVGSIAVIFIIMIISIIYDVASPIIVGRIEETIKNDFELNVLAKFMILYFLMLAVSLISTYVQAIMLQNVGQKILSAIRSDLFEHIEGLSNSQLNTIPVGTLVTRVTNDTNAISNMFTNIFVELVKNFVVIIGVYVAMVCVNYELTLMVTCFVPFIVLFTFIFRKFSRKAYRGVKNANTDMNVYLSENLSGMKIIQIFNREKAKTDEFDEKNGALYRANRRMILVFAIFRPLVYMLYISSILVLLFLGGHGYINDRTFMGQTITSGTIVTFYMYIHTFFNPIQSLAEQFNRLQSAMASAEKIFTIFDIEPKVVDKEGAVELKETRGEIEFEHVWFAYEEENWVLKDVSFKIKPGETLALVGATGAGKSTILSLVVRNHDVQKGRILLDGVDITKYTISSLRAVFGQMLQDVFLFSGNIRTNIIMRNENLTDDEIMEACKYVNADSVISKLDNGLDSEVRERGNNFSAGERQLISFARTILKKPSIMILDEATANIDTETEILIQDSLEKMKNVGTMIVVAHRLSTIRNADKIIVMSHGEIKEQGTHEELLAKGGRYHELYMLQCEKQRLEGVDN